MASFVSRNVLICVVPAVVLLLSAYWFRKKKKMKPDILSSVTKNSVPVYKENETFNSSGSMYSAVESTSDYSNTFSDASSISSPENSLRTPSISGEALSDNVVDNDCIESLTVSNHIGQLNYNISIAKEEKLINSNSQILHSEESENSAAISPDCEEKELNDTNIQLKDNVINSFCNIVSTSLEESTEQFSPEKNDQVIKTDFNGSLHKSDIHNFQFEVKEQEEEKPVVSDVVSVLNEVIEEPVISLKLNTSLSESVKQLKIKDFNSTLESESLDSHSSVLDENSLSSVSDECERHTDFKYKDSPSSVFDGNSISDESDKTDISNEHNTVNLKPNEDCKDNVDYVSNDIESGDHNKRSQQYSIKLTKNSFFKTILTDTANEVSSSNFVEGVTNSPSSSQHNYSVFPQSLQSFSSDECFISINKEDFGTLDQHNNQPTQMSKEVDSSEASNSSCVKTSTNKSISLDTENVISSTSSETNFKTEQLLEKVVDTFGCDLVSSTGEIINDETIKVNGSKQLDSLSCADTSSEAVKLTDEQLEHTHDKASDLDVGDMKSSGSVPGLFVYEFDLPQELCGRLIGRQGKHVKSIKERTNANVFIKRHPFDSNLKTVVVEGSRTSVHEALDIIRRKFPPSQFPTVTLIQTNMISSHGVSLPESLQLHLPEGASCDVILSSLVSAGHFFLQQPTHPTYPSLSTLDQCMINCYTQMDTPLLPQPVEAGVICAAPVMNGWFRAQIIYVFENRTECEIKFVDYGGFSQVPISSLRQIRSDFMTLPFQASECYLANVRPVDRNASWSSEATAVFEELAQGQILQALLVEYAEDGIPCVHLYRVQGVSSMFINRELVERGLAVWVDNSHWDPH